MHDNDSVAVLPPLRSIPAWYAHFTTNVRPADATLLLIAIGSIARIVMANAVGMGIDESYTTSNAHFLALSYVDYPPLHVWLVHIWSWLCGNEAPGALRLPFIALFAGSSWLMYRLAAFLFTERAGVWAAVALNLAPVFTLSHASWILPDGPLLFFNLAAANITARLLLAQDSPSRSIKGWMLAGFFSGLALLSKYHGAFVPLAVFAFMLTVRRFRPLLATPGPWLAAATALLMFAPVLAWNSQHHWIGLFFQSDRLSGHSIKPMHLLTNLGGQAAYLSPWIFVPLAAVLWKALRRGTSDERTWFLGLLAIGPILFFTLTSAFTHGLPHWTMPGWTFAFPLLGTALAGLEQRNPALPRTAAFASLAVLAVLMFAFATQEKTGWLTRILPPSAAAKDPTLELIDWNAATSEISRDLSNSSGVRALAATRWFDAGKLDYAMGQSLPVFCLCDDPQEFRYRTDAKHFAGTNMLVVGRKRELRFGKISLRDWFDRVETLPPIQLLRNGEPAITLYVYRGIGFHPRGLGQ